MHAQHCGPPTPAFPLSLPPPPLIPRPNTRTSAPPGSHAHRVCGEESMKQTRGPPTVRRARWVNTACVHQQTQHSARRAATPRTCGAGCGGRLVPCGHRAAAARLEGASAQSTLHCLLLHLVGGRVRVRVRVKGEWQGGRQHHGQVQPPPHCLSHPQHPPQHTPNRRWPGANVAWCLHGVAYCAVRVGGRSVCWGGGGRHDPRLR
jgi:hypothetical protein